MEEIKRHYNSFFRTKGGEHLMEIVSSIITSNHEKAEKTPESARDYVQRAKGAREVLDHIQSVLGGSKK